MMGAARAPRDLPPAWRPPEALAIEYHETATVLPLEDDPGAPVPFRMGALSQDGRPIALASHLRGRQATAQPAARATDAEWAGNHVFGGMLWDHFGHFLLEGLSRAWAFADLPGPIIWVRRAPHARLTPWQADILQLIGLGGREHRVVTAPVRVGRLAVPQQGLVMWRYLHPRQAELLAAYPFRSPEPGRRVWLSRSGLPSKLARIDGETLVEATLSARGWTILHPENMSIAEQLAALEAAELIAGFAGSAFHGLLLARDIRARIVIISRGERLNPNYQLIAAARGFDQHLVSVGLDPLDGEGALASYRLRRPAEVLEALDRAATIDGRAGSP